MKLRRGDYNSNFHPEFWKCFWKIWKDISKSDDLIKFASRTKDLWDDLRFVSSIKEYWQFFYTFFHCASVSLMKTSEWENAKTDKNIWKVKAVWSCTALIGRKISPPSASSVILLREIQESLFFLSLNRNDSCDYIHTHIVYIYIHIYTYAIISVNNSRMYIYKDSNKIYQ